MSNENADRIIPQAEGPSEFTGGSFRLPDNVAAGLKGVAVAAAHVFKAMGPFRAVAALHKLNQKDGYDCPGCAWPDPDGDRSFMAEYCENGVKAIAEEATSTVLDDSFFRKNSVSDLSALSDFEIGKKGRIGQPLYLAPGASHYSAITWDDAFLKIAKHLHSLNHPDEAVFYTSGRTSNEAAFLYQLFVREFGTNNLPDCSNMCHESSGVALHESLGIGKGSVKLEDFYKTELIIIIGQNPGTNHPRMLSALKKAKENGAKIISINPLPEAGLIAFSDPQSLTGLLGAKSSLTDLFLQVKINGDMALLKAIGKLLLEKEADKPGQVIDTEFITKHTKGFEEYRNHLSQLDLSSLSRQCGISLGELHEAAMLIAARKKIICCWAMGLTQHRNAVDTIREVVNILLLRGSIGKEGAGTCPVRGHSNVQGDRTMGIYEKPSDAFLDRIEKTFGFKPPRKHGYDTVDAIHAMKDGKAKFFFALGGNFLSATPDTHYTAEALRNCTLTVHVSTKLNRSHLIHGKEAIILPTLGRSDKDFIGGKEQFVSCENSMGVVHSSRGNLKPVSDNLLSEVSIVCRMADAVLGSKSRIDWKHMNSDYDNIRNAIEKSIPGFEDYNTRVKVPGGFYLPNSNRENQYKTVSGKAEFSNGQLEEIKTGKSEYLMMSIRSHDQFNTTIYGLNDRYRGVKNERRVVFMNAEDMAEAGLKKGDVVDLTSEYAGRKRIAHNFIVIPYSIPRTCVATYYPETNVLVPVENVAAKSNTPVSKSVVIKIHRNNPAQ
ncbi:MAG: hypothetical protein DWQ44_13010 [Bacteroidetes bacterium]|nr:MAG: hypothetical protein DWQ33_13395 [Bacteroidota bacterium]REK05811.1 MAG: hypothetical protein DWQ39_05240 [Bacteroidota bacterium]REK31885.1 MAG: hypothetical protein DWQ44_13010 [Bacteroidota bacterium]REK49950.1 MAG: hypothetical protein DWQ48_05230 [Bacteroidota bacterium]